MHIYAYFMHIFLHVRYVENYVMAYFMHIYCIFTAYLLSAYSMHILSIYMHILCI